MNYCKSIYPIKEHVKQPVYAMSFLPFHVALSKQDWSSVLQYEEKRKGVEGLRAISTYEQPGICGDAAGGGKYYVLSSETEEALIFTFYDEN